MASHNVGISDIALYIPAPKIELGKIVSARAAQNPELERRLRRAVESTGQRAIRFPESYEDNASIAASAAFRLLSKHGPEKLAGLRYLAVGTETGVDMSKPVAAYVEGMLQRANLAVPKTLSTFQVQHACAGGTIAMLSVSALLQVNPRQSESGLVLCSDIARYETNSTAEITQGAGSAAILIEKEAKLLQLDLETAGYASNDVDDFFRPLGSETARVKGQYSMKCYHDAAEDALNDHAERSGRTPAEVLEESDFFVFHVPFAKMAYTAARHLLSKYLHLSDGKLDSFLMERGFFKALESTAEIGNIYTGSAFLNLTSMLHDRWLSLGKNLVGKKVLFFSYGSGNTMIVISATVAPGGPEVIKSWDMDSFLNHSRDVDFSEYSAWADLRSPVEPGAADADEKGIPQGVFFLKKIREDGYREYAFKN